MSTSGNGRTGAPFGVEAALPPAPSHARIARRYAVAAIGCAAFALIYAQFSHGVQSAFMTFMFAIPLLGGAVPALVLRVAKAPALPRAARQAWALALASLAVASCLRGVFDIAGTASPYLPAYLVVAVGFAALAVGKAVQSRAWLKSGR